MVAGSVGTTRAVIYCRVSSSSQEDGYSLETQESACRTFVQQQGLSVTSVAREVWSGGDRHRPELEQLLENLLPGDIVVAYALDRVSRSQIDTAIIIDRIERAGAALALVTEDFEHSATGTFLRSAKAFVAELEREKIRERTQRGRVARVKSGKPIPGSRPPFGYQWVDDAKTRLELDLETAPIVRDMFDRALTGASLRSIAASLDARGIPTPYRAKYWSAKTVRAILLRPLYSTGNGTAFALRFERLPDGRYRERAGRDDERMEIAGIAPPIVSLVEQQAVASRLATNQRFSPRNNRDPEGTLLRNGFCRCGYCGWAMRVSNSSTAEPYARYACSRHVRGSCPNPVIKASILDEAVWAQIAEFLRNPELVAAEVAKHRDDGGLERDLAAVESVLGDTAARQARTARAISVLDDDEAAVPLVEELKALKARRADAEQERDVLRERIADAEADRARIKSITDWCARVAENVESLTYEEKRLALDALGIEVRVWRVGDTNEAGEPRRWEVTMDLAGVGEPIVLPGTCSKYAARRRHET